MYSEEKEIRPGEGWRAQAVCPGCGYAHPFSRLPLYVITGASGTGKSALALALAGSHAGFVHLESDILWRPEFNCPEDDFRDYRNLWLRLCKNISQAGQPVALYGSVVPSQFEPCSERRYFDNIHYLALVCEPRVLEDRLRARQAWRGAGGDDFVEGRLNFNRWFMESAANLDSPFTLLDTSDCPLEETAGQVRRWLADLWHPAE